MPCGWEEMKPIFHKMSDGAYKKGNFLKMPITFDIEKLQSATNELFTQMS